MWLILLSCAWLTGIALGLGGDPGWWPLVVWAAAALAALTALYPERWRPLLAGVALLTVLFLGGWRARLVHHDPADLPAGQIEAVRGHVADWPARGDRGDVATVAVTEVRIAGEWRGGAALVRADLPPAPAVGRGDLVELFGYYRPVAAIPQAGFRTSLERRGQHGQFRAFTARVLETGSRDDPGARRVAALTAVEGVLRRHIPGAEGALVTGILLGDDHLLPRADRDAFDATSTSHVMALSGWNIALIAALCALVGRRFGRGRSRLWLASSALALWGFVFFVGAGSTLVRAAIMGTLYLIADGLGRRGDALTALAVSAIGMTAQAPGTILDIGFQLSCAATLGLIVAAGPLAAALARRRIPRGVADVAAATVTAEVFTLPLMLHHFGRVSTVTLPANLLIEPLVPLIMAGGTATGLAALVPGPLAAFCGLLTWLPARLLLLVVEGLADLPWVMWHTGALPWTAVALAYGALALAVRVRAWFPPLRRSSGELLASQRPTLVPLAAGVLSGLALGGWVMVLLR